MEWLTFLERQDQITFQADDVYTEMLQKLVAIVLMPGHDEFKKVVQNKAIGDDSIKAIKVTLYGGGVHQNPERHP